MLDSRYRAVGEKVDRSRRRRRWAIAITSVLALLCPSSAGGQPPSEIIQLPGVTVTAPARLPGTPMPSSSVPAALQVIDAEEIRNSGAVGLPEILGRLPGISLSDEQGNSFQPDVTVRGFQGTSVTGAPQGISVFLDGVRLNEPAAEEINFDLIPLDDVDRIELYRGPTAIFGRNTLGGALNIVTRRGGPTAHVVPEIEGGRFGRQKYRLRLGGTERGIDYYAAGTLFREDGWRDQSEARLGKAFGKLGYRGAGGDVTLSFQHAENRIEQPGSLPLSELRRDRTANFTGGDFFRPTLTLVTLNVRRDLGERAGVTLNAFGRFLDAEQFNANLIADNTRLFNRTTSVGGTGQLLHESLPLGRPNRLIVGFEWTHHDVAIRVGQEKNGRTLEDCAREAAEAGIDGVVACPLKQLVTRIADEQHAVGAFAQDTLDLAKGLLAAGDRVVLTGALRGDWLRHDVVDSSPIAARPRVSGTSAFGGVSPRLGVNYNFSNDHGAYAVYSRGFRAPAFLELTCASPGAVCPGLQAGVATDPPLKSVKVSSYEIGVRSRPVPWLTAEVALFRADVTDDILAVSPTGTTGVFFQNIGSTRREGVEVSLSASSRALLEARIGYAFTRATFQDDIVLTTPRFTQGCARAPCTEDVRHGNDLPLIPRHRLNAGIDYHAAPWLTLSLSGSYTGPQRLRGDEANVEDPLDGYFTLNARARVEWRRLSAFVSVNNLLNAGYETFGTFAANPKLPGAPIERFLTPAPPIHVVAGASYRF
jgi:iron complex outermembrane recepter protein